MSENNKEMRTLTLMDTFKLYLWTMWRAGHLSEESAANLLGFVDRLSEKETADFCFGELEDLKRRQAFCYEGRHRQALAEIASPCHSNAKQEASSGPDNKAVS